MSWKIRTDECCATLCAKFIENGAVMFWIHDVPAWVRWAEENDRKKSDKIRWDAWFKMILKKLKDLVDDGILTAEQAETLLKEWLRDHPDPEPAEQGIDVTEEFKRPIPVKLPERAPAEQS